MEKSKQLIGLLLSLLFIYVMLYITFKEINIFWYLYTFTLLVGIAIAVIYGRLKDELSTWQYLLFGIGYGTILYGIVRLGHFLISNINAGTEKTILTFLENYGPDNIWHYLLLIFIIVIGEELFWRGFVQQHLKNWVSPGLAVIITSILFALSVAISGFWPGAIAAFLAGLAWGFLYEWKKSLPLIIVSHEIFILLLFMILPLY
ncbi:CPBP family intramembrane glutamic endopeptidase [Ureibacillus aquaedulcis]|uniref:CPBP family intramembrane metalloprotease n=1 Tax=Ureibacillus aquaedulcis TaxID=3058421 RepID=A0ABT8GLN7_9BACL|nr:CPBP family intramembrane glutamic endopeptidase [Ureibacillus sp. BA0131]MDN4492328.1 CPBP family intramembrane metalloprotease [Ureibacillus sp. BA0131]